MVNAVSNSQGILTQDSSSRIANTGEENANPQNQTSNEKGAIADTVEISAEAQQIAQAEKAQNAVLDAKVAYYELIAALEKNDPEKASELQKKLEESQSLLKRLESSKQDINEQRKAAAAVKIAQIKEKLKALRLLAVTNPEAAARQIKQLSRELKQAIQAAGASGGGAEAALQGGTAVAAGESSTTAGAKTVTPNETVIAGETVPPPQNAENSEDTSDTQSKEAQSANTGATAALTIEEIKKREEEEKEAFRGNIQEQVAKINESFAGSQADQEFSKAVNEVKNALKSIIETIKKKLEQKDDPIATRDIKDAQNALSDIDQSLGEITSAGTLGAIGIVNILA